MSGTEYARKHRRPADAASTPTPAPRTPVLTVGHAFDPAEAEADRVADSVISRLQATATAEPADAHRHGAGCGHGDVQRTAAPTGSPVVGVAGGDLPADVSGRIEARRGGGAALSGPLRDRMEGAFGTSLGDVRIHTDAAAATLSRQVSAKAFTTGRDIFFGAGQFRPDTAEGEHMVAHELAHTRQGGGVQRTAVHRVFDFSRRADLSKVAKVSTIDSGQAVFFLKDTDGDSVVLKSEPNPFGIAKVSESVLQQVVGGKSVTHTKVEGQNLADSLGVLRDASKWDKASLAKLGKTQRDEDGWAYKQVQAQVEASPVAVTDEGVGRLISQAVVEEYAGRGWLAMSMASGRRAADLVGQQHENNGYGDKQSTRFRALLKNPQHTRNLGVLSAADLFLGNSDRVMAGNMGNWFYDDSDGITLIDHVDSNSKSYNLLGEVRHEFVQRLASKSLWDTAAENAEATFEAMTQRGDPDALEWAHANKNQIALEVTEHFYDGLKIGRERLIKVFTSSRFSGSKADRRTKKSIKATSKAAARNDEANIKAATGRAAVDPRHYYDTLKNRAAWLKKN